MFASTLQNPQSYLVDGDTTSNGRPKLGARPNVNGRARSATNPEPSTPQSTASPSTTPASSATSAPASGSRSLTRTVSTPTTSTTSTTATAPKAQSKPRRGFFSLLASAAQPPTPPKPDLSSATASALNTSPADNAASSNSTVAEPSQPALAPGFMQAIARRLSGSSSRTKSTDNRNQVPECPRRILNVNYARPRPEIKELEHVQLRRVCFVADETLVSKRLFKSNEPFEMELPRENKLKVRDLKECYYRSTKNREITPDDRVAKAFSMRANGVELTRLDLSTIKFPTKEAVVPICDVLSLAKGLEEVVLDHCELTDDQLRLFLSALLSLRPRPDTDQNWHRGISRLSIAGNTTFGINGWRSLALFVHLNADLVSLNISHLPISLEAAQLLSRAIALPNPPRREIPSEARLRPVSPKPRSRKFSFRRASQTGFGVELARVTSPNQPKPARRPSLSLTENIAATDENIDEKPETEPKTETQDAPASATATPPLHTSESSSIVVVDPPTSDPKQFVESSCSLPMRFRISELRMNQCDVTLDILQLFLSAVKEGCVRFWDIGNNKFGVDGMKLLAALFTEIKPENERLELQAPETTGRRSPTPASSVSSAPHSAVSVVPQEMPTSNPSPSRPLGKLEYLSLKGTDLSSGQLEPLLEVWLNHSNPENLSLWALELPNCRLGRDLDLLNNLFKALSRFPHFKLLNLQENPLFANPGMIKVLRDWLPQLSTLRILNLASTGMTAGDLVELSRILPKVKLLAKLDIHDNPIYELQDDEKLGEGQTEDVSGLIALDAAMRYCRQIIELVLPEGGGNEGVRLHQKLFLRCFKNIEFLDHVVHPQASDDPAEYTLGGQKHITTGESKELALQTTSREGRDKYEVDRGHGVARALETVLLNASSEDKAQDMSLDLLYRARKIKERLQPALVRRNQDEATLRRLTFLSHVLTKVINRFEEAFPECSSARPKPKSSDEPDSSEDEGEEDDDIESGSPPSPGTHPIRRSSSMSELARGLELEEGDVHRFNQFVKKRGLHKVDTLPDLSSEQLLEAILSVDKETVEREVWDKAGLQKVLRKNIDDGPLKLSDDALRKAAEASMEDMKLATTNDLEKKDSDLHSI